MRSAKCHPTPLFSKPRSRNLPVCFLSRPCSIPQFAARQSSRCISLALVHTTSPCLYLARYYSITPASWRRSHDQKQRGHVTAQNEDQRYPFISGLTTPRHTIYSNAYPVQEHPGESMSRRRYITSGISKMKSRSHSHAC